MRLIRLRSLLWLLAPAIVRSTVCYGQLAETCVEIVSLSSPDGTSAKGYPLGLFPIYPFEMKRAGISGEAVVRIASNSEGRVIRSAIVSSSQREFEPSILAAASRCHVFVYHRQAMPVGAEVIIDCRLKFFFEKDEELEAWSKRYAVITRERNDAFELLTNGGELPHGSLRSPARIASYEGSMVAFHGLVALVPRESIWFRILIPKEFLAYEEGDWVTTEPLVVESKKIRDAAHGGTTLVLKKRPNKAPEPTPGSVTPPATSR